MAIRPGLLPSVGVLILLSSPVLGAQTLHGPTPYLQRSDSPLLPLTSGLYVEDMEDGVFNAPGVTSDADYAVAPGSITDSVDADDGVIDGSGVGGWSLFRGSGSAGITFTFDPTDLGQYPTHAGVVWTDGAGTVSFEAFDSNSQSLGTIGPSGIPDNSITGETAEDHFFGISFSGGISAIKIWNTSGGIEVDHLQYNYDGIFLETSAGQVSAGDPLSLITRQGLPGKLVIMVVIDVNAVSLFQHIATSTFDVGGGWNLSATVPPGLNGLDIGMISIGAAAATGKLDISNRVEVKFQ